MKLLAPSKTFLVGEYSALIGGPALIANTTPCFELRKTSHKVTSFHPESPAGKLLNALVRETANFEFMDPHAGSGGLGASSAQFVLSYMAFHGWPQSPTQQDFKNLLNTYLSLVEQKGLAKPSGYDVLAQALGGVAYINSKKSIFESLNWPFEDIGFVLFKTGIKLPTHEHLARPQEIDLESLAQVSDSAVKSFLSKDSKRFIEGVSLFTKELTSQNLVATHTQELIRELNKSSICTKGCGAMGADVVCSFIWKDQKSVWPKNLKVLATDQDLVMPHSTYHHDMQESERHEV